MDEGNPDCEPIGMIDEAHFFLAPSSDENPAGMSGQEFREEERGDFTSASMNCYFFITDSFASMLSEARKWLNTKQRIKTKSLSFSCWGGMYESGG